MATCIETMTCVIGPPLDFFTLPFTLFFAEWFFPMVWGLVLSIIYLRSHNAMLTSFIGLIIAALLTGGEGALADSSSSILFRQGYLLVIAAGGASLFFLIRHKSHNPAQ